MRPLLIKEFTARHSSLQTGIVVDAEGTREAEADGFRENEGPRLFPRETSAASP
jgi:hypothetical protein